ncbi:MAG: hypothetical protein ACT4TC_24355 [Myxococcaceae bacterium]
MRVPSPIRTVLMAGALALLCSCASWLENTYQPEVTPPPKDENTLNHRITVRRVAKDVWLHVTDFDENGGIPSNGLLVETGNSVILVDTGWSDDNAAGLIAFGCRSLFCSEITQHSSERRRGVPWVWVGLVA